MFVVCRESRECAVVVAEDVCLVRTNAGGLGGCGCFHLLRLERAEIIKFLNFVVKSFHT